MEGWERTLYPLIHTFPTRNLAQDVEKKKSGSKNSEFPKLKPRYCSLLSRAKVWIKVCNPQSDGQVRASETTDFEGGHPGAHLISIERHKERQ